MAGGGGALETGGMETLPCLSFVISEVEVESRECVTFFKFTYDFWGKGYLFILGKR